jgi:hypothetical protein
VQRGAKKKTDFVFFLKKKKILKVLNSAALIPGVASLLAEIPGLDV